MSDTHLLTISVEDFFHSTALNPLVPTRHWTRLESRVERSTQRALALLDEYGIQATFFALGWVADQMPEIIRQIADQGHELACKGYHHRGLAQLGPAGFREEVLRGREAIEQAAGRAVIGHRIAQGRIHRSDQWALDILAEEGFTYDSSVSPQFRSIASRPWLRFPHVHEGEQGRLAEFPISTWGSNVLPIPIAGGNYFRQFPERWVRRAFEQWTRKFEAPFNMYFHVWELDPDLPQVSRAGWLTRLRQYRNLDRIEPLLRGFFGQYCFQGIADHLRETGFASDVCEAQSERRAQRESVVARPAEQLAPSECEPGVAQRVTVVVPCYNEEVVLPYLANTLEELRQHLGGKYAFEFIFVDDASTDRTWESLARAFGDRDDVTFFRHEQNLGVCASILTGLRNAKTEIVCSMDCDCTYDPHQFERLIPLLDDGVDLVTASPYHPDGAVSGVPRWRLFLSRYLSRGYQLVFHHKLWTYTSCFRVYRRSTVADVQVEHNGYLGIAEMLARLDFAGKKIVECPALLEVRLLGYSKMKTLSTIFSHARLLARLAHLRVFGKRA